MVAENLMVIASELPEEELQRLYKLIGQKLHATTKSNSSSSKIKITERDALEYLLKNIFARK